MPKGRFRLIGRVAVAGACVALAIGLSVPAASAGHGDNATSLRLERDNNSASVERIGLAQSGNVACVWGKRRLDNTEVNAYWAGNYDIRCRDGDYNKWWFGFTDCTQTTSGGGYCAIYRLRYDWDYGRTVDSAFERRAYRYIGCHEFGHTSSIGHRAVDRDHNSCMKNGHGHIWFDGHDHTAIDRDR